MINESINESYFTISKLSTASPYDKTLADACPFFVTPSRLVHSSHTVIAISRRVLVLLHSLGFRFLTGLQTELVPLMVGLLLFLDD